MATEQVQNTEYLYPSTWTNLTDTAANYAAGFPEWANQTYQNWYNQPLTTGTTPTQQNVWNQMLNPNQQWTNAVGGSQQVAAGAQPYFNQAGGLYQASSQYDPAKLQEFMNPYTGAAADVVTKDATRNLIENILPNVNSTFTGAGQFGSSRNAEFESRAIRDTQEGIAKALATANYGAVAPAQQAYQNWATLGQQAGAGLGGLGTQQLNYATTLANLANTGSGMTQQQLTNALTAATQEQQQQQTGLTTNYEDWLKQQQFPLTTLGALSSGVGAQSAGTKPNVSVPVTQPDDVTRILAAVQAASQGMSDQSVQSILDYLFPSGTFNFGA